MIVPTPGGGCRAAVALGNSTCSASATHRAGTEGAGLEAAAPEDREAELSATIIGEGTRATEVFTAIFFFFPFSALKGGGRLTIKDEGGTSAYTVGDLDLD